MVVLPEGLRTVASDVLAERLEKSGLALPANFMFTDARQMAVWTISTEGGPKLLH